MMIQTWQGVREEVERRLHQGIWKPGEIIPTESTLSAEFGCARATVNRALQSLAEQGLVERKRKAGTRVIDAPRQTVGFSLPILRDEIESTGAHYTHKLLKRRTAKAPKPVVARLYKGRSVATNLCMLNLKAVHLANDVPYCLEDRWINPQIVPNLDDIDFTTQSANEFLVRNVPYSQGDLNVAATRATREQAKLLHVDHNAALLQMVRTTWLRNQAVTSVTLLFPPGYQLRATV